MRRLLRWIRNGILLVLLLVILAAVVRLILFKGPVLPPEPLPRGIVDLHCHTAGLGAGDSGCFISPELEKSMKFPVYLKAFGVTLEEVQTRGDAVILEEISRRIRESRYVEKAVILALDGVVTRGELDRERTQVYVPNEFVAREVAQTDHLYFGASINPYRKDALERLEVVVEQKAVLLKWIPSIMAIDPADEALVPFYRRLAALELPLLTHTGQERSFLSARDELCDPVRLRLPLSLGVTVIAAHIATTGENEGQDDFERIQPLFREFPNLYADISSLTQINKLGYLERALRLPHLKGRLVYGTDWPLQFFPMVSPWFHPLRLELSRILELQAIENPWDRDALLKQQLGVPAEVFRLGETLLRVVD